MLHHEIYLYRQLICVSGAKLKLFVIEIWSNALIGRSLYENVELNKLAFNIKGLNGFKTLY